MLLFAILLPVILGMVGLLYSVGFILIERRAVQTAADAASTAATWRLLYELEGPDRSDSNVLQQVQQYAAQEAGSAFLAAYTDASGSTTLGAVGSGVIPTGARGVQVKVQKNVPIVLDKLIGITGIVTAASSTAALVPTSPPNPAMPVLPVAVNQPEFVSALASKTTYDLLAPTTPPQGGRTLLDFANSPASSFAGSRPNDYGYWAAVSDSDALGPSSIFTNLQFWSDGRHPAAVLNLGSGGVTLALVPPAPLANSAFTDASVMPEQTTAYRDAFTAGLRDNIQQQVIASGKTFGMVVVPLWDTSTTSTVHVVGVGLMRVRLVDVTSTSAKGQFVLYPAAAWGTRPVTPPTIDVGARLVRLIA
jgi:Putative Flp pilus-assembly TadE/G-like